MNDAASAPQSGVIANFEALYRDFAAVTPATIAAVYDPAIVFRDPVHQLQGLQRLQNYFMEMAVGLDACRFHLDQGLKPAPPDQQSPSQGRELRQAFYTWNMVFAHPRLRGGREINVRGATLIQYRDKIEFHEDFYDLGALLYEQVPLLGSVVSRLKNRLVADSGE